MNRASLRIYFGWHLIAGLLVFAAMTLLLGQIADDVLRGEPLTLADVRLTDWLHQHRSRRLTMVFWILSYLGSTVAAVSLTLSAVVILIRRHQKYWLTTILVSVFGGILLNWLLKLAFQRERPLLDDPIFSFTGYSFPSGHTMTATVLYGALAALLVSQTARWPHRLLVVLAAGLVIALVGFSRIYLGAHYLSDVLAAIAEGLAWLSLCLTGVYYFWRERNRAASRKYKKAG